MNEDEAQQADVASSWRWAELLFGSSVIVYLIGATVSGIWWAASISKDTDNIGNRLTTIERRFDGLDNVALANRITKVEVELQAFREQQARVERKIDRLLERRYGNGSGPGQAGNQE